MSTYKSTMVFVTCGVTEVSWTVSLLLKIVHCVHPQNELWLSDDFGSNWKKIHDMVCLVKW